MDVDEDLPGLTLETSGLLCIGSASAIFQPSEVDEGENQINSDRFISKSGEEPSGLKESYLDPILRPYPEIDYYDERREEEEKKIERYASMTSEEVEQMNREYSTFSCIPNEDSTLIYRQKNYWWPCFQKELKEAKRIPRKPTTACKYFLEFWSENNEDLNELREYNPYYDTEVEKRKIKQEPDNDNILQSVDESVKKLKIDENYKPKEEWKVPTFGDYKKQISDRCRSILISTGTPKSNVYSLDFSSVDSFIQSGLKKLEEDIAAYFYNMKCHSFGNSFIPTVFVKEISIEDSDSKEIVTSILEQYNPSGIGFSFGDYVHVKVICADDLLLETVAFMRDITIDKSAQEGENLVVKYLIHFIIEPPWNIPKSKFHIELRRIGCFNHYYSAAKSLIHFKEYSIHQEFINPILSSFSSGVTPLVKSGKVESLKPFYENAIQKALDTVALHAPKCSSICVIDDIDWDMLKEIIVPIAKSCFLNEYCILDPTKTDFQVLDDQSPKPNEQANKTDKLRIIITAPNDEDFLKDVSDICKRDYKCFYVNSAQRSKEWPTLYQIEQKAAELLRAKTQRMERESGKKLSGESIDIIQAITTALEKRDTGVQSALCASKREHYLALAKHEFLKDNQILMGTISDLFNHDCLSVHLNKKLYQVAIVYNPSIHDTELVSLLGAGVEKLILIGASPRTIESNLMYRMVQEYEKNVQTFTSEANSPVISSFVEIKQPEKVRVKEEPSDHPVKERSENYFIDKGPNVQKRDGNQYGEGHNSSYRDSPHRENRNSRRGRSDEHRSRGQNRGHHRPYHNRSPYGNDHRTSNDPRHSGTPRGAWYPYGHPSRGSYRGHRGRRSEPLSRDDPMHPNYKPGASGSGNPVQYSPSVPPYYPNQQHPIPSPSLVPGFESDIPGFSGSGNPAQYSSGVPPYFPNQQFPIPSPSTVPGFESDIPGFQSNYPPTYGRSSNNHYN